MSKLGKLMIQKVEWLSPEAEGKEQRGVVLNGCRVSVLQDEKVLEICFTILQTYLAQLNCALKMVKIVNVIYIFLAQ